MTRALRWALDVVRGYSRAADCRERVLEQVARLASLWDHGERLMHAEAVLDNLHHLAEARAAPGPLGVGARLAIGEGELRAIRQAVEDHRITALSRPMAARGWEA